TRIGQKPLLAFHPALIGDVPQDDVIERLAVDRVLRYGRLGRELVPAATQARDRTLMPHAAREFLAGPEPRHVFAVRLARPGRNEDVERLAQYLLAVPAEDPLRSLVEVDDSLVRVHGDHRIRRDAHDPLEP